LLVRRAPARIAPSILAADFGRLAEEVRAAADAGADWLHVDVMDGHFVPNITIGPSVVAAIHEASALPLDVHLMISEPLRYAPAFIAAGASSITVHQETCADLAATVDAIRDAGARAAVALNPPTPVHTVEAVAPRIDMLLVMSVHPGFGGQSFIAGSLEKIRDAAALRERLGAEFLIEVDGGITEGNVASAATAGVDVFVAGTAIFGASDYGAAIAGLRRSIAAARTPA
jgi:ribulose-phosphate 3-epimerase